MLGEMYTSKGYALETCQAVLERKDSRSINIGKGCTQGCTYCYGPSFIHCTRDNWNKVTLPKENPAKLIAHQLSKGPAPEGVFLSFLTDPLLPINLVNTNDVIHELHLKTPHTRVAVLSKTAHHGYLPDYKIRYGATIVSFDMGFHDLYEVYSASAGRRSMSLLNMKEERDAYVWISMEPYPPSAIFKQDIYTVLEDLSFVDFILFGKWNNDARASTPAAKLEYKEYVGVFRDFCKSHNIRSHVKSETLKFIGETP